MDLELPPHLGFAKHDHLVLEVLEGHLLDFGLRFCFGLLLEMEELGRQR